MYIVYKVTSPSNKSYIGITKVGLSRRKYVHTLRALRGSTIKFHCAISKYGDRLQWEVLKSNLTKVEAIKEEISLIKFYKSIDKSYNICDGGEGTSGYVFTTEDKYNIRLGMSKVDLTNSEDTKLLKSLSKGGKSFKVSRLDGSIVGTWINLRKAARDLDIPKPHIWRCLKGLRKTTRNLKFEYIG